MPRTVKAKRRPKSRNRRARVIFAPRRRAASNPKRSPPPRKRLPADLRLKAAVREMNRGRSLTATARFLRLSPKTLKKYLKGERLLKRNGRRWATKDIRPRRIPVMTGGRFRVLTVRGYEPARLVGEHHLAAGEFVRTNDIKLLELFRGQTVQAINGRRYPLETDPNALHRIAAMDSPPFHEIYEIISPR